MLHYTQEISFLNDMRILVNTVKSVLFRESVELNALEDFDEYRKKQLDKSNTDVSVGQS